MTKVKFNHNYGLKYFYKYFVKRKIKFPKSYFFYLKTRPRTLPIDYPLYKKVIIKYLDTYFNAFYSHEDTQYFPLSGELVKVRGKGIYKNKGYTLITDAVNWVWFLRPAINFVTNIRILKMTGGNRKINNLEKKYKNNFDAGLLPYPKEYYKKDFKI